MSVVQLERRQLVLFDLDGTLVDTASDMYRAMNITLRDLGWPGVRHKFVSGLDRAQANSVMRC